MTPDRVTPPIAGCASWSGREVDDEQCATPPEGWYCTRADGHDGPCAAYPKDDVTRPDVWFSSVLSWKSKHDAAVQRSVLMEAERDEARAAFVERGHAIQEIQRQRDARIDLDDPQVRERIGNLLYRDTGLNATICEATADAIIVALKAGTE